MLTATAHSDLFVRADRKPRRYKPFYKGLKQLSLEDSCPSVHVGEDSNGISRYIRGIHDTRIELQVLVSRRQMKTLVRWCNKAKLKTWCARFEGRNRFFFRGFVRTWGLVDDAVSVSITVSGPITKTPPRVQNKNHKHRRPRWQVR